MEAEQVTVEVVTAEAVVATVDEVGELATEPAAVREGSQKQRRAVTPFEGETLPGGKELSFSPAPLKTISNPTQCLSVGPGPWTQSVTVPQQGKFIAGELTRHLNAWRHVTDDYISLQAIVGVKIPLLGKSPLRRASKAELDERRVDPVKVVSTQAGLVSLINSLQELLELKAVQEMQEEDEVFLSRVFTVPKARSMAEGSS